MIRKALIPYAIRMPLSSIKAVFSALIKTRRIRFTLLVLLFFYNFSPSFSQELPHQPGKILVSTIPGFNTSEICRRFEAEHRTTNLKCEKKVSDLLNTWLLSCDAGEVAEQEVLRWLRVQPEIRFAQVDHLLELRRFSIDSLIPNDPLFDQQWQYQNLGIAGGVFNADLDAPAAWDYATGGSTAAQDTIVIAVIDGGVDKYHPDIQSNLWKNHAEIPYDSIDNDNNGYVDDYHGWNVWVHNDEIQTWNTTHGTPVCGIIGAKGNNNLGVAGVNWNVKIMFVAGSGYLSNILESYDYVYKARKRYNDSQGQEGAFVVAVNSSWGVNYGHPDDAPLWCAVFDSLGHAGILSVAATANLPINVDVEGDLPTTCPSPYLISVTSLKSDNNLDSTAAWGPVSIDLGAYGNNVFTTATGSNYNTFSGTSFAAPHVSGAAGLAYASDCPDLIALAKADPEAGAMMAKAIILNSTVPNNSLNGKVLTDGRLNLATMAELQPSGCSSCPPPFDIKVESTGLVSVNLSWLQLAGQTNTVLRWRHSADSLWEYVSNVSSPWTLTGLDTCTDYTVALISHCGAETSGWSYERTFNTTGCCPAPVALSISDVTSGSALVSWQSTPGYNSYLVRWKVTTDSLWNELPVGANEAELQGLMPCTDYVVMVGTLCVSDSCLFANAVEFKTTGCGTCIDLPYCASGAQSSVYECIASVTMNGWEYISGNAGSGYQNFTTGLGSSAMLPIDTPFEIILTPGYWGNPSKVYFRVYVDLNANGSFNDPGELLYDPGFSTFTTLNATVTIPPGTIPVETRLRVVMKHMGTYDLAPGPCEIFEFGQVEDYCVQVGQLNTGVLFNAQTLIGELQTWPVPSTEAVWFVVPDTQTGCSKLFLDVVDAIGHPMLQKKFTPKEHKEGIYRLDIALWPAGVYTLRLHEGNQMYLGKVVKVD